MTLPVPLPTPSLSKRKGEAAGKWTCDADGNWSRRPTPAQDAAWIASMHQFRDAALSHAKQSSKLSVQYFRWAGEDYDCVSAARYAAEGRRLRRKAREYLREARNRNV